MKLGRCPKCHGNIHLEDVVQDESASKLLALVADLDRIPGRVLVSYMTLFRSTSRDLTFDRALRIANEVMELAPIEQLAPAMVNVVEQMRNKQATGGFKPLTNHAYLRKVIESAAGTGVVEGNIEELPAEARNSKSDKRSRVSAALMDIKDTDW